MGFWSRVRQVLSRWLAPVPPAPRPKPRPRPRPKPKPKERPPGPRQRPGRGDVLRLGRPSPTARALYAAELRSLWGAALQVWPRERIFTIALYARYVIEDPGDGERYPRALVDAYGHAVPIAPGRAYYGWRSVTINRSQLERFPDGLADAVLNIFQGKRPIRCATVGPK